MAPLLLLSCYVTLDKPLHLLGPTCLIYKVKGWLSEATVSSSTLLSFIVYHYYYCFGINPTALVRGSFSSGSGNLINDVSLCFARGVPSRALIGIVKGTAHV